MADSNRRIAEMRERRAEFQIATAVIVSPASKLPASLAAFVYTDEMRERAREHIARRLQAEFTDLVWDQYVEACFNSWMRRCAERGITIFPREPADDGAMHQEAGHKVSNWSTRRSASRRLP